jgi:hypothetical protein
MENQMDLHNFIINLLNQGDPRLVEEALLDILGNSDQNNNNPTSIYNEFINNLLNQGDPRLVEQALLDILGNSDQNNNNPNSDSSTVTNSDSSTVTNSNDNNWSLPNVEVTNGFNHCWMAAVLSVLILLPDVKELLNLIFDVNLDEKWGPNMYDTINSKLQLLGIQCDQERDSTNMGNPHVLLTYLKDILPQFHFQGNDAQDKGVLLSLIGSYTTIKGIIYHNGIMSSNISMNTDQNVYHWKSIIRNPNGEWHKFDSLNGGYDHSTPISNEEAAVELLGKYILIISS